VTTAALEITKLTKAYGALRPLRIDHLSLGPRDQLALLGFDQPAAEILVNLVTGATLPDQGDVVIAGRSTAAIADSTEWLAIADTFGIVSERAVLLDAFTALQNLAIPFSLDVDPLSADIRERAASLAREVGLDAAEWDRPLGDALPISRLRVRVGRALALQPRVLLLEHPSAALSGSVAPAIGRELRRVLAAREVACLTLTADSAFGSAIADRVLRLEPGSGRLVDAKAWFGRWRGSQ
jgi:ABC-type sulfate/molybdate transport systems ATPase subunit